MIGFPSPGMPIMPPDHPLHRAAAVGFEASAGRYARGRPDYPPALDRWLCDTVGLRRGKVAVDLGAGTGKFTGRLLATDADVVAIEPVDAMRARLVADFPAVDVRAGSAEALPLAAASVDAVACAQAFHWFANTAATRELARVIRPGGVLALVWNVRDASVPWVRAITDIIEPFEGDAPRFHKGEWQRVFPAPGFSPLREVRLPHVHRGPPEQVVVERFLSVSFIAALPDAQRAEIERRLRALIADEPALAGAGEVAFPYETVAYHATRE
jgi:SAM-dependent methyltransferase